MTRAELVTRAIDRFNQQHQGGGRLDLEMLVGIMGDMIEDAMSNGVSAPPPVQLVAAHSRRFIGQDGEKPCSGAGKPPTPTGVCPVCYQRQTLEIADDPGTGVRHG